MNDRDEQPPELSIETTEGHRRGGGPADRLILAIAALALLGGVGIVVGKGLASNGNLPSPAVTATAIAAATPSPSPGSPIEGRWLLDFAGSNLSNAAPGCVVCSLGSSLTLAGGAVGGQTGAGGGCDHFVGTYALEDGNLVQVSVLPSGASCYPGSSVQEIHRRLGLVRSYEIDACGGKRCDSLTFFGANGTPLLHYLRDPATTGE